MSHPASTCKGDYCETEQLVTVDHKLFSATYTSMAVHNDVHRGFDNKLDPYVLTEGVRNAEEARTQLVDEN